MFRTARTRALTLAGSGTAALTLAGIAAAGSASAQVAQTVPLNPGDAYCVSQPANYQVRGDGSATGQGARFKLLRNGVVLDATPGRVNTWADERRTSYGTFPGPGSYAVCAYNTGTARTTVFLQIRSDGEFS